MRAKACRAAVLRRTMAIVNQLGHLRPILLSKAARVNEPQQTMLAVKYRLSQR